MTATPQQWIVAGAVVFGLGGVGLLVGRHYGHPIAGTLAGLGAGAFVNYQRRCVPCMQHLAAMRRA